MQRSFFKHFEVTILPNLDSSPFPLCGLVSVMREVRANDERTDYGGKRGEERRKEDAAVGRKLKNVEQNAWKWRTDGKGRKQLQNIVALKPTRKQRRTRTVTMTPEESGMTGASGTVVKWHFTV